MKKRHEQKLVILGVALFMLFNIPLVQIFEGTGVLFGFPVIYFSIFSIWILAVLITYIIIKRHYE
ncbi:hypothetical protein [Crocinitomix algicola]|uniref:hypothetical protein n=1 Tax=Crocinitomix algicola TaxID=1740263 RepID=UPI000830D305|nr:hypothetical protein [Crocinitomix algicola]